MTEFLADLVAYEGDEFSSGSLDTVAYDREGKRLLVEFQSGGTYVYDGVEESTYNMLVEADSLNHFWRDYISGKYTSTKDHFYVTERPDETQDDDAPVDLQPETKFITINGDGLTFGGPAFGGTITVPTIKPARYSVKWVSESERFPGPFQPEFNALSEADALVQFNNEVTATERILGETLNVKIVSVTHYFD